MTDATMAADSTLVTLTRATHAHHGDRTAVTDGERSLTFSELAGAARGLVDSLAARGVRPGDRVVWALDNRPEVLVIEHALFGSGLVRVALSSRLHPREIVGIARDAEASVIFCEPRMSDQLGPLIGDDALVISIGEQFDQLTHGAAGTGANGWPSWIAPGPDDLAALMYTSGTTGEPKGAMVTHRAWIAMLSRFWSALPPIGPEDIVLHCAPMSHFGGSVGSAISFRGGAAVTLSRFDADSALDLAAHHRATVLPCVPTILSRLATAAADRTDLATLRAVVYGGSALGSTDADRAVAAFPDRLYQCYGLAEALAPLTVLDAREHSGPALASAGRPRPGLELMIKTDDRGLTSAADLRGEICVRGAPVTAGYWNRPDATAAVVDQDGWFATGDIGFLDQDGLLHIVDRARDVIISGGFNIYPSEIERVLREASGVSDAVVFGVPDQRWGETVTAVVVPDDVDAAPTPDDIVAFCRSRLADYKKPTRVRVVDRLPIANTGKVDRRRLRENALAEIEI
ncbi:class I adenylate-forming enzyme family protein [Microlunatus soli]|uniref:Acyl-CoA synthetase (AMP-forming)/AMP-acid ligase II n=1 Tax=Microlunatus soli TaxID=630515 RepID=A0A1H1U1G1_9ACTN|nr:class I adenylate-forming enzyme family protein [Microlunatus soli]SDS66224.1 Acyl-CoA synthetase (AMP-forming)/AMP-acid ligase II [Microlunatus soli]